MAELSDRRKESRKVVMAFTPVYDLTNKKLLGYLRDLTLQGAQVNGEKKLVVDTQITLSIQLPEELVEITTRRLNIPARVARCVEDKESPNFYELGFEFKDIQPEQMQIIEALLNRYHFRHRMY